MGSVVFFGDQGMQTAQQLSVLLEAMEEGIICLDGKGGVTFANRAAADMTGYQREELLGQDWFALTQHQGLNGVPCTAQRCPLLYPLGTGPVATNHAGLFRRRDGSWFPADCLSSLLEGGQRTSEVVVTVRDLSRQWRTNDSWLHSQKLETIGRLAGQVAHDLNNFLAVITGCGELLLKQTGSYVHTNDLLADILKAADRGATLAQKLLSYTSKQEVKPHILNLNTVIGELSRLMERLLPKNITLVHHLGPHLDLIRADEGQIEQVLFNLVLNARDAMPGGGTITIQTGNITLNETNAAGQAGVSLGRFVMLALSDMGSGLSAEAQNHLFEPFFTTKEPGKGTGLGLATVFGIVHQNQGHIEVHTKPNEGTTFQIFFPCADKKHENGFGGISNRPGSNVYQKQG